MRSLVGIGLAGLLAIGLWLQVRMRSANQAGSPARPDMYEDLRAHILKASRSAIGLPPTPTPTTPWGVVMDWGVEHGSATVVALSDGSASIYLSSGGGFIGGQGQEPIRKAAQKAVSIAADFQAEMRATKTYPLPHRGEVIFYLLTDVGSFTASGAQDEMSGHQHRLSRLADAMQQIITEYREFRGSPK